MSKVVDYKMYPIADSETPKLSSDRLEYTFSSGLNFVRVWDLETIKKTYGDLVVLANENGVEEIGFKTQSICEEYIDIASSLWPEWISTPDKVSMQFIADIVMAMINQGYLNETDLYTLKEIEVVNKILSCPNENIKEAFKNFQTLPVIDSEVPVDDKYFVSINSKTRYVNPLVRIKDGSKRISELSPKAKSKIDAYLNHKTSNYGYIDLYFEPQDYFKKMMF